MHMSQDKCINCHNINIIKANDATQTYSLCQVCQSVQEIKVSTSDIAETECSKGSSENKTQNGQKIGEQVAEMKITDRQRNVQLNFQWNGQRSKDVCMFCGSTLLQPYGDSTY